MFSHSSPTPLHVTTPSKHSLISAVRARNDYNNILDGVLWCRCVFGLTRTQGILKKINKAHRNPNLTTGVVFTTPLANLPETLNRLYMIPVLTGDFKLTA